MVLIGPARALAAHPSAASRFAFPQPCDTLGVATEQNRDHRPTAPVRSTDPAPVRRSPPQRLGGAAGHYCGIAVEHYSWIWGVRS
ncbi:MAG TPA: hypothetical protein VGF35_01280, partial [Steroidobacteraceae bacterium]